MLVAAACFCFTAFLCSTAAAYPRYVAKGYPSCTACHYSPTGGGLPNAYGRATVGSSFSDSDNYDPVAGFLKGMADGTDNKDQPALTYDTGADVRLLSLVGTDVGGNTIGPLFVPMLAELGGAVAYGKIMLYGSGTLRKGTPNSVTYILFSREHWLKFRANSELNLRAGRLMLPFGLRLVDHTQYVREDFGFGKWGQTYAVEADWFSATFGLSVATFVGDLIYTPGPRQERGGVVQAGYTADVGNVGISFLGSSSEAKNRGAASLHARIKPFASSYVLAELAGQKMWAREGDDTLTSFAAFARGGYFVADSADVFLEMGLRDFSGTPNLFKYRLGLGSNWHLWRWLEFIPQGVVEREPDAELQFLVSGQLHVMY